MNTEAAVFTAQNIFLAGNAQNSTSGSTKSAMITLKKYSKEGKTMNSEQLITEASRAITEFRRQQDCYCYLYVRNEKVVALVPQEIPIPCDPNLKITQYDMERGFTNSRWNTIGTALLNLYNKDVACHARQKH